MSHEFFDLIRGINAKGWTMLNFFQYGNLPTRWRVNLQKRSEKGAALETFTEFSDHTDPIEALRGAVANAVARDKEAAARLAKTASASHPLAAGGYDAVRKSAQEKRLIKALDANFGARKGAKPHGRS